ncbi:hypothetical protein OG756_40790 [Streptomyces sp. NBC_01310]|uniref:hypothetical protein n=1 Tax=Streptomyces sp. NBC_01310 TaxID=2903820 RepID=UPI0035B61CB7|nr:hypothetical protein OG756_00605 [Streptomyces sp. NBC_01310]WSJ63756.1 hypothetical protein OG756_40790 [Streptomyces sp. NBC_01310]
MNETRTVTRQRPGGASPRVGAAVCTLFLTLGNLAASYFLLLAHAAEPAGPWDSETVAHSGFAAGLALALAVVTALLTWVFVKAEWLRRWWFTLAALFALAAILRLTLLAPEL